jgi:hypothetical protein
MDFRRRQLRLTEQAMQMRMLSQLLQHQALATAALVSAAGAQFKPDIAALGREVEESMRIYEAELYQEIYLPKWQRELQEKARKERMDADDIARRDLLAPARVTAMTDDDAQEPKRKG